MQCSTWNIGAEQEAPGRRSIAGIRSKARKVVTCSTWNNRTPTDPRRESVPRGTSARPRSFGGADRIHTRMAHTEYTSTVPRGTFANHRSPRRVVFHVEQRVGAIPTQSQYLNPVTAPSADPTRT